MTDNNDDFLPDFIVEASEHLASAEGQLLDHSDGDIDKQSLDACFRSLHTVKGGAGFLDLENIQGVAHIAEQLLEELKNGHITCLPVHIDLLLATITHLLQLINDTDLKPGAGLSEQDMALIRQFDTILIADNEVAPAQATEQNPEKDSSAPATHSSATVTQTIGNEAIECLEQLTRIQDGDVPGLIRIIENLDCSSKLNDWCNDSHELMHQLQEYCDESMFADPEDQIQYFVTIRDLSKQLQDILLSQLGLQDSSVGLTKLLRSIIALQSGNIPDLIRICEELKAYSITFDEFTAQLFEKIPNTCDAIIFAEEAEQQQGFEEIRLVANTMLLHITQIKIEAEPHLNEYTASTPLVGEAELSNSNNPNTLALDPDIQIDALDEISVQANSKTFRKVAANAESKMYTCVVSKDKTKAQAKNENSTRVSTDRLDDLINMVGELLISESMLKQNIEQYHDHELNQTSNTMHRIVRNLQSLSMSLRMVPLKTTFRKMARAVHDTSRKLNKKITFNLVGEDTEIDRILAEKVADPLLHMVRNAVDHGIESNEKRRSNGKNNEGSITLSASQTSEHVVIQLRDDGKGMDPDVIRKKAIEIGIIDSNAKLSRQECFFLIFKSGFSTAEQVTGISGRGVGMDVVRRNIQEMNGIIEIESDLGKGSCFTLRLPLTTAILDAMLFRCGNQRFLLPITSIVEANRPTENDIDHVFQKGQIYKSRGQLLPLISLGHEFNTLHYTQEAHLAIVIVIECYNGSYALQVDEILGQHQVVIKPLNQHFEHHPALAGSAILGDGHVGLILDPNRITHHSRYQKEKPIKT